MERTHGDTAVRSLPGRLFRHPAGHTHGDTGQYGCFPRSADGEPGGRHSPRHTARTREARQYGCAVADEGRTGRRNNQVRGTGQEQDGPPLHSMLLQQGSHILQLRRADGVCRTGVNASAVRSKAAKDAQFRSIALNDGRPVRLDEVCRKPPSQGAEPDADGIEQDGDPLFPRRPAGPFHGFHPLVRDVAQVDGQGIGPADGFHHLVRMGCHVGACPQGEDHIGAVIHGDGMGQAVDQGLFAPYGSPQGRE